MKYLCECMTIMPSKTDLGSSNLLRISFFPAEMGHQDLFLSRDSLHTKRVVIHKLQSIRQGSFCSIQIMSFKTPQMDWLYSYLDIQEPLQMITPHTVSATLWKIRSFNTPFVAPMIFACIAVSIQSPSLGFNSTKLFISQSTCLARASSSSHAANFMHLQTVPC